MSAYGAICAQIMVTDQEIRRLAKDAPALRQQYLLDLIETAEANNDHKCARAILQMMKREHRSRVWRGINYSTQLPCGGYPLAFQVTTPTGVKLHDTEATVFEHATKHLSTQFRLAYSAPCYSSQLL
jgi:hypothetical protein